MREDEVKAHVLAKRARSVWVITESALLTMLRRVADGESPDVVYAEAYLVAEREPMR